MPASAPSLLPERRGAYDRFRARVAASPALHARLRWLAPVLLTLLAGILRFWNVGHPHAIVFDETYYVKDAWSQWNLGYAAAWPEDADAAFVAGDTDGFSTDPSYVVHPPLGKYLIGVGMWLFGPDSSFGWRFSAALFGTAAVLVLYLLALTLTRSVAFASVATFLFAIDGLGIEMSRIALLDIFLTFFVLLAVYFIARDRATSAERLADALAERPPGTFSLGPVLWNRPWVLAAGAAAGAASAVKWSGVWVLAALGLYLVVSDALARRRLGVTYWPTDAVFRQGPISFLLLVPVALVVYLASWVGWLTTAGGYGRHLAEDNPLTGVFAWVPSPLQSLWRYHEMIYASMAGMSSEHSYASPAWQWPALIRPTSMYANSSTPGENGCVSGRSCLEIMYSMPNPLIWWAGVAAVVFLLYRLVVHPRWQEALVLTALAAGYLPWLAYPDRTIFQFYTIVLAPFMILALTFALREIAGPHPSTPERRLSGTRVVLIFLAAATLLSAFWYPLWSAIQIPYEFYQLHNWMRSWI